MKSFLLAALLVFGVSSLSAQDKKAISIELAVPTTAAISSVDQLPKTMQPGQEIRVVKGLAPQLTSLLAASQTEAQCKADCKHEDGAIDCPVGRACYCGCPGGYSSCGCK